MTAPIDPSAVVILIRHAFSAKNALNYHGHNQSMDYPLTPDGLREAQTLGLHLKKLFALATVASSDSLATRQTATAVAAAHGATIAAIADLRAVNMGDLAQLPDPEIATRFPAVKKRIALYNAGALHPRLLQIPGGEPFHHFVARIGQVIAFLVTLPRPLAVIGHHSSLNMLLNLTVHGAQSIDSRYTRYRFPNLGYMLLAVQPASTRWTLLPTANPPESTGSNP